MKTEEEGVHRKSVLVSLEEKSAKQRMSRDGRRLKAHRQGACEEKIIFFPKVNEKMQRVSTRVQRHSPEPMQG